MLIIMNPPYGDKSKICKQITNKISGKYDAVILEPFGGITDSFQFCDDYKVVPNAQDLFPDAGISNLNIFSYKEEKQNNCESLQEFAYKDDWFGEYLRKNNRRPCNYDRRTANRKCKDQGLKENVIFYLPNWLVQHVASSGPQINKSLDNFHNIYGSKIDWDTPSIRTAGDRFIYFENRTCFRNFRRWVYKEKKLWTEICKRMWKIGMKANFEDFLPRVDWSRTWTDKEILKELGLPEDLLTC